MLTTGHKSVPVEVKATGDEGIVECLVSVFDNVDSYGDIVRAGAFIDSIKSYDDAGNRIPFVWSHASYDPHMFVGYVLEAKETDAGLWIKAQIDLSTDTGMQVFKLLKNRVVTQFSFAYEVIDGGPVTVDGETHYELRKLGLFEVGPTMIGANRETELIGAKSLGAYARDVLGVTLAPWQEKALAGALNEKAGRTLSAKNETALRSAYAAIGDVLAQLDSDTDDSDGDKTTPPQHTKTTTDDPHEEPQKANDEEPATAKSEEPDAAKSEDITRDVAALEAQILELYTYA